MTHPSFTEMRSCLRAVEAGMADLPMVVGWDVEDGVCDCTQNLIDIMLEELDEAERHGEALMRCLIAEMIVAEMAWKWTAQGE